MIIYASAASHVGKIRDNNEDNLNFNGWLPNQEQLLNGFIVASKFKDEFSACVCDGMGGESFGEEASKISVETFGNYLKMSSASILNEYIQSANEQVCNLMLKKKARIGSTFTGMYLKDYMAHIANLGDSKVLRYRQGMITQISHDHTTIQSLIDNNIMTIEQIKKNKIRNSLTQYLGIFEDEMALEAYYQVEPINVNDVYILCSDGLTDMVDFDSIKFMIERAPDISELSKSLIVQALKNGGRDNITITAAICK